MKKILLAITCLTMAPAMGMEITAATPTLFEQVTAQMPCLKKYARPVLTATVAAVCAYFYLAPKKTVAMSDAPDQLLTENQIIDHIKRPEGLTVESEEWLWKIGFDEHSHCLNFYSNFKPQEEIDFVMTKEFRWPSLKIKKTDSSQLWLLLKDGVKVDREEARKTIEKTMHISAYGSTTPLTFNDLKNNLTVSLTAKTAGSRSQIRFTSTPMQSKNT
ncbi:MAG TPA: hypothetical protein VFF04_06350 [Candidatus Babeliales bacterium]|nr:hypothetical protein [Candidatus Babeliales bacterium]